MSRFLARCTKLVRILRNPHHARMLARGVVASVEHEGMPFSFEARTVLDVGANRGQFLAFALARFPGAQVLCFEPLPEAAAKLRRIARRSGDRVRVVNTALGAHPGKGTLYVTREDDSSSLLPPGPLQDALLGSTETRQVPVNVRTLDEWLMAEQLARPVLLKLDVQGFEGEVLRGARHLLLECDELLVECSFVAFYPGQDLAGQIITDLSGLGFQVAALRPSAWDRQRNVLQADLLFRR